MFVYLSNKLFGGKDFFVLKRKKDYSRNKTKWDRLQALAIPCSKSEIALPSDYDLIINKFVECKVSKKIEELI